MRAAERISHSLRSDPASAIRSSSRLRSSRAAAAWSAAWRAGLLQTGQPLTQLGCQRTVPGDPFVELGAGPARFVELGGQCHPVVGHPLAGHSSRLVGHLVPVVSPDGFEYPDPGGLHRRTGRTVRSSAAWEVASAAISTRDRASSTTAAVTTPPAARTLQPEDENRSPSRVTTTRSGRARATSMASDHPLRTQHDPERRVSRTAWRLRESPLPERGRT